MSIDFETRQPSGDTFLFGGFLKIFFENPKTAILTPRKCQKLVHLFFFKSRFFQITFFRYFQLSKFFIFFIFTPRWSQPDKILKRVIFVVCVAICLFLFVPKNNFLIVLNIFLCRVLNRCCKLKDAFFVTIDFTDKMKNSKIPKLEFLDLTFLKRASKNF